MASGRQKLFEELGLLESGEQVLNPLAILGIDPEFASNLLKEDKDGEALRFVATGLHRILSRRYHPDLPDTGDAARWTEINEANTKIDNASPASLSRWSKRERTSTFAVTDKMKQERTEIVNRTAGLIQDTFELGNHPEHFSQMKWSQGVLTQRSSSPLLFRERQDGKLQTTQGYTSIVGARNPPKEVKDSAFDIRTFMKLNDSFGLTPDSKYAAFVDDLGRASILTSNLRFLMDVSAPVHSYRVKRTSFPERLQKQIGNYDLWARNPSSILYIGTVPGEKSGPRPRGQLIAFPGINDDENAKPITSELNMEIVGSISNPNYFKRIRHSSAVGAVALGGSKASGSASFNMLSTTAAGLIESDAGYSPLITVGNSLMLFDRINHTPVITDVKIVGLIGNNAQAR
jgi:hypothetical protein